MCNRLIFLMFSSVWFCFANISHAVKFYDIEGIHAVAQLFGGKIIYFDKHNKLAELSIDNAGNVLNAIEDDNGELSPFAGETIIKTVARNQGGFFLRTNLPDGILSNVYLQMANQHNGKGTVVAAKWKLLDFTSSNNNVFMVTTSGNLWRKNLDSQETKKISVQENGVEKLLGNAIQIIAVGKYLIIYESTGEIFKAEIDVNNTNIDVVKISENWGDKAKIAYLNEKQFIILSASRYIRVKDIESGVTTNVGALSQGKKVLNKVVFSVGEDLFVFSSGDEFDARGFHRDTHFNIHTGNKIGPDGYDIYGFDDQGKDQLGLDNPLTNAYRNQKISDFLTSLSTNGITFEESTMLEDITSLEEIKEEFAALRAGGASAPTPPDKDIYNDLKKLAEKVAFWKGAGYQFDDISKLKHVQSMIQTPGQHLSYQDLWQKTEASIIGPKDAFYIKIYDGLNDRTLLANIDFPDETDAPLNGSSPEKVQVKREYFIQALASIKNPSNPRLLLQSQHRRVASSQAIYPNPTSNHEWLARQRYRLYHIAQVMDTLTNNDKATLLASFLHAGKHCSDAKEDQFLVSFSLFNPAAAQQIKELEEALAITLSQKLKMLETGLKSKYLGLVIDAVFNEAITLGDGNPRIHSPSHPQVAYVKEEGITFKKSTWDRNAPLLGLPLKGAMYFSLYLVMDIDTDFMPYYSPSALVNEVDDDINISEEIVNTYFGSLRRLMNGYSHKKMIIRGVLMEEGFLENK